MFTSFFIILLLVEKYPKLSYFSSTDKIKNNNFFNSLGCQNKKLFVYYVEILMIKHVINQFTIIF